jgi:hypothetical protein
VTAVRLGLEVRIRRTQTRSLSHGPTRRRLPADSEAAIIVMGAGASSFPNSLLGGLAVTVTVTRARARSRAQPARTRWSRWSGT